MIESNRPEENKTSDVEMFFEQFHSDAPAPKVDAPDPQFDKEAAARFTEPAAPKQSFGQAFAAARKNPVAMKAGVFEFNGKKYSTNLASDKPKQDAPAMKPMIEASKPAKATLLDEIQASVDARAAKPVQQAKPMRAMAMPEAFDNSLPIAPRAKAEKPTTKGTLLEQLGATAEEGLKKQGTKG